MKPRQPPPPGARKAREMQIHATVERDKTWRAPQRRKPSMPEVKWLKRPPPKGWE